LGGTIWHIQHGLESIVYAVDWNQAREHVLAGAAWLGGAGGGGAEVIEQLRKPTALICSARGAERIALGGGRNKRDEKLLTAIKHTVSQGGTVLIPTDSSARVLELAYLLEHEWRNEDAKDPKSPVARAGLFLASRSIDSTIRYAKSMLEWMDEGIVREFETASDKNTARQQPQQNRGRNNNRRHQNSFESSEASALGPFDFRHLRYVERKSRLEKLLRGVRGEQGKVILASDSSLAWGFSRDVLARIAGDEKNLVILTERMGPKTDSDTNVGSMLYNLWEDRGHSASEAGSVASDISTKLCTATREILAGNDATVYQQYLSTQRQLQTTSTNALTLEASGDAIDDGASDSSSSSDESEDGDQQGKALTISATLAHSKKHNVGLTNEEMGVNVLLRGKGVYDYDVRGKKGRERMFPLVVKRIREDEWGEVIRPEQYLRAEEREDIEEELRGDQQENLLGKKRKWGDSTTNNGISAFGSKRRQLSPHGDGDKDMDAPGYQNNHADSDSEDDDEPEEDVPAGPSKVVFKTEMLQINLRIAFVDFAGLHDSRSLRMLIPLIAPRKLILIGGDASETSALAADCRKLLSSSDSEKEAIDVFTPSIGMMVDASVDTNAWTLKLSHSLVRQIKWQNVRGLGVVHITGRLAVGLPAVDDEDEEKVKKKLKMIKGEEPEESTLATTGDGKATKTELPLLDMLPASIAASTRSVNQPIHVGDLRLADLRKILQASGHTAEFRGEGTLLVDGMVAVRKSGTGRIEVEGGVMGVARRPASFYEVKRTIYEGLAVVAGG
jgi:cleavage and polyadenylation specificity factor subunit 2